MNMILVRRLLTPRNYEFNFKNGEMLKKIGSLARGDIEKMLDKKVYLELWVRVKNDWRNNNFLMKSFGYEKDV